MKIHIFWMWGLQSSPSLSMSISSIPFVLIIDVKHIEFMCSGMCENDILFKTLYLLISESMTCLLLLQNWILYRTSAFLYSMYLRLHLCHNQTYVHKHILNYHRVVLRGKPLLANQADLITHTFVLLERNVVYSARVLNILNTNDVLLTGYNLLHLCFSANTKCKYPKIIVLNRVWNHTSICPCITIFLKWNFCTMHSKIQTTWSA